MQTPRLTLIAELVNTLKQMEAAGINTVIYSITWGYVNKVEGNIKRDYIDMLADAACSNTNLKVAHCQGPSR